MKNLKNKLVLLTLANLMMATSAYAIVDYSETVPVPQSETRVREAQKAIRKEAPTRNSSGRGFGFSLLSSFHNQSMPGEGKFNKTSVELNIETPVNVWFNGSFWQGSGSGFSNQELNKSHKGNPEVKMGFNFLQVGTREDLATMDIYGGAELSSQSKLASSRTDQIYGLDISKRFVDLALGLGYELRTTGKVKNTEDYDLGNIQRIKATFGWMVSPDIQFQTDFITTSVGVGEGTNALPSKMQYSTLAPRLNLKLASVVNFTMGADFLIQRPKSEINALALKINSYAPTGTTLVAGLGLSF